MTKEGHKKIVVIFPRGEAIANFLSDVFVTKLKEDFSEVHFLTIEIDCLQKYTSLMPEVDSVKLMKKRGGHYVFRFMNGFLDMAHNLNIKSVASKDRIKVRRAQAFSRSDKIKLELNIFFARFFASKTGTRLLEKACGVANRLNDNRDIKDYIKQVRPDIAFNTSHVHGTISERYLYTFRQHKIKLVSFIFSWDNITSRGRIIPRYDQLFTWNEESKALIEKFYGLVYKDRISVTGTPQFDHYFHEFLKPDMSRETFCNYYNLDSERPIVLYSTGMPHHMPGEPIVVKRILDGFEQNYPLSKRPQMILRVYPKDYSGRFEPLRRLDNIVFQDPLWNQDLMLPSLEAKYMLKQTLKHVDMGINIASTITLELLMFDKKVLNIGFTPTRNRSDKIESAVDDIEKRMYSAKQRALVSFKDNSKWYEFDHYRDVTQSNCIVISWDEKQLMTDIEEAFDFEFDPKNKEQLMNKKFSGTLDGNGAVRIASTLGEN